MRWWKETDERIEFSDISNAPKTTMQLAHFRSTSIQGQLNYVKKCWNQLLLLKEKIPAFQIQSKENWMENTDIELLNLVHFKTKAKASDESHATFISTSENATSTPLSNEPLDQNEASDIDFNTGLSFDINKMMKLWSHPQKTYFLQHQFLSKIFKFQNHHLKFHH